MATWDHLDDPRLLIPLIAHPANDAVARTIEAVTNQVRAASDASHFRRPQEELVSALSSAEGRYHQARRRVRRGGTEADRLEQLFWRRAVVQLRAAGDAIAWHFLNFRRQWILLLGRNQHPGLMTDKGGFAEEYESFSRHWNAEEPSLLTGLTNCITLADLLVAEGEALTAYEIKRGRAFRSEQTARLRRAVEQINIEPRVDGPSGSSWIVESSVPLLTYWRDAAPVIERAKGQGVATWVPAPGVAVIFFAWSRALEQGKDFETHLAAEQRSARDLIGGESDRIVIRSLDYPYRSNRVAPMTIFPIPSAAASLLVTGQVSFTVELRIDALANALRSVGFEVDVALGTGAGELPPDLLHVRRGNGRGTVHRPVVEQLGIELLDLDAWAASFSETFTKGRRPGRWGSYVCLADEGAAWL